ncbi:SDR family NAD(P)-dependent oxidoreductase [candidate division KSB1 bacterium]|nr:SDR family NAD(P)-dependent oxidoreductase [candidate division KSB1 bacterium]
MKLQNKTILITGASTGIGKELAIQLAEKDNRLVLIARRENLLQQLIESLPKHPDGHLHFPCDVSDLKSVQKICTNLIKQAIIFDVLILNAGIGGGFDVSNIDIKNFRKIFDINLFGTIYFLKHLLPPMIERQTGLVSAVSSLAGYRGMPKSAPYSTSKAALSTLMESLRIDLWNSGVKVSLISPGFVKTPMTDLNDYYMPFMIPVEKAAKIIIKGLEKEKTEIHFPYRLSLLVKLFKLLPNNFYAKMMQGRK